MERSRYGEVVEPTHNVDGALIGVFTILATIATSTIIMFGLMYLNTWAISHVWFSQIRMWRPSIWMRQWLWLCWLSYSQCAVCPDPVQSMVGSSHAIKVVFQPP